VLEVLKLRIPSSIKFHGPEVLLETKRGNILLRPDGPVKPAKGETWGIEPLRFIGTENGASVVVVRCFGTPVTADLLGRLAERSNPNRPKQERERIVIGKRRRSGRGSGEKNLLPHVTKEMRDAARKQAAASGLAPQRGGVVCLGSKGAARRKKNG
jgi:hypothetical protein